MNLALGLALALALAAASAHAATSASNVSGSWTNPIGACTAHIVSFDPGTGDLVCTGTSRWRGTWTGSTTWTLTGNQNPASGAILGRIDEVFTGRVADGRAGTLTFVEHLTVDPQGALAIRGHITKGSGAFVGADGRARWIGTTKLDGSGAGTYSGRWHQGRHG